MKWIRTTTNDQADEVMLALTQNEVRTLTPAIVFVSEVYHNLYDNLEAQRKEGLLDEEKSRRYSCLSAIVGKLECLVNMIKQ